MTLTIYTDGGSRGNPGPASIGIVAFVDNKQVFSHSEAIGITTNNVAEYSSVISAYTKLIPRVQELKVTSFHFKSDSKLLVEQLCGRFKVKTPHIAILFNQVKELEKSLGLPVIYEWVRRSENTTADALVNQAHQ